MDGVGDGYRQRCKSRGPARLVMMVPGLEEADRPGQSLTLLEEG